MSIFPDTISAIWLGNAVSAVSAAFLIASCLSNTRKRIFYFQVIECVILAIANIIFNSWAGFTTLAVCAVRNLFIAHDRFTKPLMLICIGLTVALGLWANNRGWVGLLPMFATVEYTVCCHYIYGVRATRISLFLNLLIWVVYALLIRDYATALSNGVVMAVDLAAIIRGLLRRRAGGQTPAGEQALTATADSPSDAEQAPAPRC